MLQRIKRDTRNTLSDSEMSASGGAFEFSESNSSSSTSVSSSTSCTSDSDELQLDALELAKINSEVLRLPRGLCENVKVFHEFFSADTWNILPESTRARLEQYLPKFTNLVTPQEAAVERQRTLVMLFNCDLKRFGHSPLTDLQHELEDGNYRPDVLRLRQSIAKSRRREQRFQRCERYSQLAKELFLSRERLLRAVYKSAPGSAIRSERTIRREQNSLHADTKLCTVRSRKRFRKEIEHISEQLGFKAGELSADEEEFGAGDNKMDDFYHSIKADVSTALKPSAPATDRYIFSTLFKRRHELTDEDAVRADQQMQQQRLSNRNFRTYIRDHKRRKLTEPTLPDFETSDIRLRDVCARAQMGSNFKHLFGMGKTVGRKPKTKFLPNMEPPALVPIQSIERNTDTSRSAKNEAPKSITIPIEGSAKIVKEQQQTEHFQSHLADHSNSAIQHPFLPEDGAPFNILDGEVELQQEEVETYGTCEEALPRFVISNEIVLPTIEHSDLPPQKLLQTPHKEENGSLGVKGKFQLADNKKRDSMAEQNIPKLEPLLAMNRTPFEKNRSHSQSNSMTCSPSPAAAAIVSPIKRQTLPLNSSTKPISPANIGVSSELIQETHACFFSLIRDFFCATSLHRMQYNELRSRIDVWLRNPITALNDWYAQADNWSALLMSAINFLAGEFTDQPEEYVPYIEFKPQQDIFQWIGAGRDSDARLSILCNYWLQRRYDVSDQAPAASCQNLTEASSDATGVSTTRRHSIDAEEAPVSYDGGVSPPPPPPPRCPTTWTVCAATPEEVIEFQRQERERFDQPHRAYTYRMHNYESVVGPVKGIYTQMYALTKARGHSMMIGNRPNFVTILTLVRDATARLPNGEGTRADIAELLKSSQYINLKEGENVLQTTVSGALDRMHTEHDPCVRYDPKRKIWIYLHRNRSEEDFERIHQQHQGIGKSKKVVNRKPKAKGASGAKAISEISDNNNAVTTGDDENNVGIVSVANNTPKASATFSMPALVPANPIIVSSQSAITQQKLISVTSKPSVNRSLPVPPLKYNIPHQQQKSLLKSTVQSHSQRQQEHRQVSNTLGMDAQVQHNQRIQQRVAILAKSTPSAEITAEENKANKQLGLTMSPTKSNISSLSSASGNSTPIIIATPTGLQTVHVSNATVVTTSTGAPVPLATQQSSPLSATLCGKKVALNKPIIINQIRGQSTIASTSKTKASHQQIFKQQNSIGQQQQQKHTHGFIIPISMSNAITNTAGVEGQNFVAKEPNLRTLPVSSVSGEGTATIYMDNAQFISNVESTTPEQQQKQTQAKNIIRLVPSIGGGGVKSILQSTSTGPAGGRKQPVHVIGHRVVTGGSGAGAVRSQTQQGKSIGNISLMSSSSGTQTCGVASVVTAASGSTLIKMSPQTFATLQQKQGQHIVVKQSSPSSPASNQQQRVIDKTTFLKNTSIVTQSVGPGTQTIGKTIFMQQTPTTAVIQKSAGSAAASVGSQTSASTLPATSTGKVHTINATNLTSQQQRALLQNIKQQNQQQQNIHFKSVQVVSSGNATPQTQTQQVEQMHQVVPRAQTLTVIPSLASGGIAGAQSANSKAVAVMVSQGQGISRVLKTGTTNAQSQQQAITISTNDSAVTAATAGGTRILTTSGGQIISLESLLQKQSSGGSLKISPSSNVGTIVKSVQTSNVIQQQQQQPQLMPSTGNTTTYTVVSQARSVNAQRSNTTQAADSTNTSTKTTLVSGGSGRILVSAGGQLTAPQIAKVLAKTGTTTNSVAGATTAGGNIRLIKNATNVGSVGGSFNISNLQGKQVVFATKPATTVTKNVGNSGQPQQIQTTGMVIGGQTVKLQRNQQNKGATPNSNVGVIATHSGGQMQTVIMGNQILRVQQMPTSVKTVASTGATMQQRVATLPVGSFVAGNTAAGSMVVNSSAEATNNATTMNLPKTVVLGSSGQTIRLQQSQQAVPAAHHQSQPQTQVVSVKNTAQQGAKTSNVGRVVLAVQGGGQIFLSPNFQGNTLNLKSLQNMKVVSLTPRTGATTSTQHTPDKQSTVSQQNSGSSTS
ncbi:uncharacterized protein LOC129244444 [Anastrepha obliqua]|uniref:uncharacterized protein LOC129244444 n=1 Tax=Anastrepha obliqua TaxID=95512 RepID=UPI002409822E|nr:uncharacterized protein LOC129244444 [Anastrepha obliqua]XP_054738060.1 uncharacterized protein LOC129244444 [Anastrepha obliqua]XP_054738068.1 uncharacterized protein LOC129244444 [Anastrepha obliqua]